MDIIAGQLRSFADVSSFISQHLSDFLKQMDWRQLAPVLLAVFAKVLDDATTRSRYSRPIRIAILFVALVTIFNVFSGVIHQSRVDMPDFVRLLIFWGLLIYFFVCELLLVGGGHLLNRLLTPTGRWIREIEYRYLLLGLVDCSSRSIA
jgi:hypothetical protein